MVQRLAPKTSDRLPMGGAACEHQRRVRRCVLAKHRKHSALVVVAEVKETVPREDAGKRPLQGKLAHIGHDPFLIRENAATDVDHGRGRVTPTTG